MALGTLTLTANLDPTGRWVVFSSTCSGMTTATLYRVTSDGSQAVRGMFNKTVSGGFVAADYEAPQNTALTYFARVSDGVSTIESTLINVAGVVDRGSDVMFSLYNPIAVLPVIVVEVPSLRTAGRREVVQVVGRPDPVVVSDVREFPSGVITLAALSDSERLGLNSLLADGSLVAFSPQYPVYGFSDVWYLSVGDVTERRVTRFGYSPERYFDLDVQRVAPPPADFVGPAFRTWQDVFDADTSWSTLKTAGTTWLQAQVA